MTRWVGLGSAASYPGDEGVEAITGYMASTFTMSAMHRQ